MRKSPVLGRHEGTFSKQEGMSESGNFLKLEPQRPGEVVGYIVGDIGNEEDGATNRRAKQKAKKILKRNLCNLWQ